MSEQTEEDHIAFPSPLFVSSSGDSLLLSNRGGSVSGSSITSLNTTATDDFMSTVENVEDLVMFDEDTISARAKKFSIPETEEEEPDNKEPPASIEATKEKAEASQSNRIASPNSPAIPPMEPKDEEEPELTNEPPTSIETEAPPSKIQVATTPVVSTEESEDESVPELDRESNSRSMPIVVDGAAQLDRFNIPAYEGKEAEATTTRATNAEESNPDAAANVYKGAKGVWAWGKSIPVFSPFMGIAEAVAGTALAVAGTNLQDLDSNLVEPQLQNLDSAILNPAIKTVAGIMLGAVGKAEGIVKPIVVIVLSPFKMLQQQPSNEEQAGRNLQMG